MVREFEGRTEKEAIDRAIEELRLEAGEFDVEILEESKGGIFKKGAVRIRVHLDDAGMPGVATDDHEGPDPFNRAPDHERRPAREVNGNVVGAPVDRFGTKAPPPSTVAGVPLESSDTEAKIAEFVSGMVERMGYTSRVSLHRRENRKIVFDIESENSAILIGRKGKNLDALQLLANVYSGRLPESPKVVLDTENYRARREENLRRLATKTAEQVRRSGGSELLEPMNPFERRIIHTTLNDTKGVTTESEGDGLYKQVRVISEG